LLKVIMRKARVSRIRCRTTLNPKSTFKSASRKGLLNSPTLFPVLVYTFINST